VTVQATDKGKDTAKAKATDLVLGTGSVSDRGQSLKRGVLELFQSLCTVRLYS
jgi:hypothetical protein